MRVQATLAAFKRAAAEALRAGHDPAAMRAVIDAQVESLDGTTVPEVGNE